MGYSHFVEWCGCLCALALLQGSQSRQTNNKLQPYKPVALLSDYFGFCGAGSVVAAIIGVRANCVPATGTLLDRESSSYLLSFSLSSPLKTRTS